ncbi:MAG: hypothetical protein ACYDAC_10230 [Candidatus Dormibacteria bacterium]
MQSRFQLMVMSLMPSRVQPRRATGRYASATSFHDLFDGLRDVALAAADGDTATAMTVSMRRWDEQRELTGAVQLPTAAGISKRTRLSWPVVLQVAFADPARRPYMIGTRQAPPPPGRYEPEDCQRTLKAVATRLGRTPGAVEYDEEILNLEKERRRRRHATSQLDVPRSGRVLAAFGSWDAAVATAGLPACPVPTRATAPPWEDTLDLCIETTGGLPSRRYLERWCVANDVPQGRPQRLWSETVELVRERRALRGLATPAEVTLTNQDPVSRALPASDRPRRGVVAHTRQAALQSLRLYGERYLAPGRAPRQKHYTSVAACDPELIGASTIGKWGRFQDMCRLAGIS